MEHAGTPKPAGEIQLAQLLVCLNLTRGESAWATRLTENRLRRKCVNLDL
jgi:hypothetical protein